MEFQDSQEKVVRIRIKQSIWDCRAGIDSGLARKKSTFLVGVLWVRLSAENECVFLQEWYKPGSTSQKYFPHLFQPLLSLTSLRGVTGRSKESSRYTDSCHGFKEAEPHSIHHLLSHADNCTGSNELPMHPQNPPSSKHGL